MKSTGKVDRIRDWPNPKGRRRYRTLQQKVDAFKHYEAMHDGGIVTFPSVCDIEILEHPAVSGILFCPNGKCKDPKVVLLRDDTIRDAHADLQAIYDRHHPGFPTWPDAFAIPDRLRPKT